MARYPSHRPFGITQVREEPIRLSNGELRGFWAIGDTVALKGDNKPKGLQRIGFGESHGTVLPTRDGGSLQ